MDDKVLKLLFDIKTSIETIEEYLIKHEEIENQKNNIEWKTEIELKQRKKLSKEKETKILNTRQANQIQDTEKLNNVLCKINEQEERVLILFSIR